VRAAISVLVACWLAYWMLLGHQYISAKRRRLREGEASPRRADGRSMAGMSLEFVAFATAFGFRRGATDPAPEPLLWLAMLLAPLAVLLGALAARSLGREFRVQAVVTERQRLITSGPYRVIRHPIYASLLGLLLATGLTITQWPALLASLAVFLVGTEIRVRVEDSLLAASFGADFEAYRKRTAAYIPFVR
jgi:protein-S-isoprenylcysteine O-methyltransferase Ste14